MKQVNKICRTNVDCNQHQEYVTFNVTMTKTASSENAKNWERFGRWMYLKRLAKGLSQEAAAEKAGMHRQQWYRLENGASTKRATVIRIAEVLGEDTDEALAIAYGLKQEKKPSQSLHALQIDLIQSELAELTRLFLTLPSERRADILAIVQALHKLHVIDQRSKVIAKTGDSSSTEAIKQQDQPVPPTQNLPFAQEELRREIDSGIEPPQAEEDEGDKVIRAKVVYRGKPKKG
jgi:transcriptional regulator with XRE-family HTH domain